MEFVVYKGNAAIEERDDSTLVRVDRQQASIPRGIASASDLRRAALDLLHPVSVVDYRPDRAGSILDRLGAIARTRLDGSELPGWPYILRHAADPDDAMRRLADWRLIAPDADDRRDDLASAAAQFGMFSRGDGPLGCRVVTLDRRASLHALRTEAPGAADLTMVVDPWIGPDRPSAVVVTDDPVALRRRLAARPRRGSTELAPVGAPVRRLLIALGVALLVDRAGAIGRLRNAYEVGHDLSVRNVAMPEASDAWPLLDAPADASTRSDAQIVDRLIVASSIDARLPGMLRLEMVEGRPIATCEWSFAGRARTVSEGGEDLGRAAVRAVASAVAASLDAAGVQRYTVDVGSAHRERGRPEGLVHVDVASLLGTDDIRIAVEPPRPAEAQHGD